MFFDRVKLTSPEYGDIMCIPTAPPIPHTPSLNERFYTAAGPFGVMNFREIIYDDYILFHCTYRSSSDITLIASIDIPFIGVHTALRNGMSMFFHGLKRETLQKHHYHIVYVPSVRCEYMLKCDKEYTHFGILFSYIYLYQFQDIFQTLSLLLQHASLQSPFSISLQANSEMMLVIQEILHCPFAEPKKNLYLTAKVAQFLLQAFLLADPHAPRLMPVVDIQRAQLVKEHILKNPDVRYSVDDLAHLVGTNAFKLKQGFKYLYGSSIHGFMKDERMQRARNLLLETDISIRKICIMTGYKNQANFATAFKRKFGYPPSVLRNGSN